MVVCKFFLQGICRFGENCKFEHQLNDGRQHHGSVLRQQNFPANTNAPVGNTNAGIDQNTLIRAVINDTVSAEKGGQWLLSCYAPFKEKPNFPGFEEQSFEEIRWAFYEAQCLGTVNQFKQQFQMSLQAAVLKLRSLQNPSPEAINTIKTIYNSSPGAPANVYANTPAPSTFNSAAGNVFTNNQNPLFSNNNTNNFGQAGNFNSTNVFAQTNPQQNSAAKSIFSAANQSLFGGPQQQQQSSIFGNNQLQNNGNLNSANPFGQSFNAQNPGFGPAQPNQQPTTFTQQPTGYGTQPQPGSLAYGNQQQTGISPFHQQPAIGSFNAQQQTGNLGFANPQNTFGVQAHATSPLLAAQPNAALPFAAQPTVANQPNETAFVGQQQQAGSFSSQAPPYGNSTNVFSNNLQSAQVAAGLHTSSIFGSSAVGRPQNLIDESIYSKPEELSATDIQSYESDNFEFGNIPEKPPTTQMCI